MFSSTEATCLSKLDGNYQGNYRSDNGQQDPNISSMFDFTNSDGVLTGQDIPGVLNSDRRHQFKLFGNYMWHNFNVGASWLPTSGTPITDLLAHPAYLNAGEIPVCPDGGTPAPEDRVVPKAAPPGPSTSTCTAITPLNWASVRA